MLISLVFQHFIFKIADLMCRLQIETRSEKIQSRVLRSSCHRFKLL